jgi:hypothetical protein
MDTSTQYPLSLEGDISPRLSRWPRLVKWFLAIPTSSCDASANVAARADRQHFRASRGQREVRASTRHPLVDGSAP